MRAIIASAAYVEAELAAEFGRIPPAFLPVGNRRLYSLQVEILKRTFDDIILTIPESYTLRRADERELQRHQVQVFRLPDGLRLGRAVVNAIAGAGITGGFALLYGDTLLPNISSGSPSPDAIFVSRTNENYPWHFVPSAGDRRSLAWVGYFQFADASALAEAIVRTKDDFINGVESYCNTRDGSQYVEVDDWLDFGHVHTYFESKRFITTQRAFNELSIDSGVVTKKSDDVQKMRAEASWFQEVPPELRIYVPNFIKEIDDPVCGYQLEYLPMCSLSELFTFGELPISSWHLIFLSCNAYIETQLKCAVPQTWSPADSRALYYDKTASRLQTFCNQTGISLDEPMRINDVAVGTLREILDDTYERLTSDEPGCPSFVHGDLCFSNILFDFRSRRIKVIDPRGLNQNGNQSAFGDLRYDVAKLSHSAWGKYDLVIAGLFDLERAGYDFKFRLHDSHLTGIEQRFKAFRFGGKTPQQWNCDLIQILLFLSMLPLHSDRPERQLALLANGLRLYAELRT